MAGPTWLLAALLLSTAAALMAVRAQEGPVPDADSAALLALRDSISNWPEFSAANGIRGWDDSVPVCQWTGVACGERGLVQTLSLQCNACPVPARGTLPPQLAALSAVTTINLQGNAFSGDLPGEWGSPTVLQSLQNLYLNNNELNGTIPGSWGGPGALPQLSLLRIDSNRITGSLPDSWGGGGSGAPAGSQSLPNLLVMRLFNNQINGKLPEAWGSAGAFPRLQILALQNNSITGSIPASWEEPNAMRFLQELFLQFNQLSGQLPGSWGRSTSFPLLQYLYLSHNPLGGTLPPEWGQPGSFPALRLLGLNSTQLSGTLPPEWGNGGFATINAFQLERNDLSGTIPATWATLQTLERLIIRPGNPGLCGPVPPGLPFAICTDQDMSCLIDQPTLTEGICAEAASGNAVPGTSTGNTDDGGGGVPAVAIAAPIAGGVVLLMAVAGGVAWAAARKRRLRRREGEATRASLGSHPFDTEEGREALTSPFAAGAFQTGAAAPAFSSSRRPADAASRPPGFPRHGSQRGTHDSVGTHSSSRSAGSHRSYLAAKCARIDTKSGELAEVAGREGGTGIGTATPDGPHPASADVEMQPRRRAGALQAAAAAAGGDVGVERMALTPTGAEQDLVVSMLSGKQGSSDKTSGEEAAGGPYPDLPFSDWEISQAEIEIQKRPDGSDWSLGSGGFGNVYKALRHGVQPVAVKVLATQGEMRQMALADFRKEVAILKACRDVNIVQFVGASLTPDRTMLVTEYMEGGNLANNIAAGRVNWYRRGKKIALDVARGLVFLHARRIVHFDVKSPNILLARDGTAKIGDVGMAKILARDYVTGVVGTLAWAAPEMLWGDRCTEKADIYSYGIVLWEICGGEKPMRGQLRDLRVPEECPAGVRDIILQCLENRPSLRPSALEIVQRLQAEPGEPPSRRSRDTPSPSQRLEDGPSMGNVASPAAATAPEAGRIGGGASKASVSGGQAAAAAPQSIQFRAPGGGGSGTGSGGGGGSGVGMATQFGAAQSPFEGKAPP